MATRTKANNTTALNLTGSWVEGIVPTSADDVVWNVNVTAAIGGDVSMKSLTIGVSGAGGISATGTNDLSLYGDIDASTGTGSFTISCFVILKATGINILVASTRTITISEEISGSFGFNKSWGGTLLLTAANVYSGNNRIYDGILKLQGSAFPTTARTYTIESGAVLNIDGDTDIGADVTIDGTGTLRVTGGNWKQLTNLGLVTISMSAGSLIDIQSGGTLTNGGYAAFVWTNNLATLNVDGTLDMWNGNSIIAGALTGAGSIIKTSFGTGAYTLSIGNCNCNGTFTGTIANTVGTIALTKNGTGTQTLTGINTYTGATTVAAGALMVTGSLASGSAVTVQNSATIGGTGTINGTLTCQAGSIIEPTKAGTAGTLTYANATAISFASKTTMKIRAPSTTIDRLTNSSVTPTFTATNVDLIIDVSGLTSNVIAATTIISTAKTPSGVVGTFASVTVMGGEYIATLAYNTDTITISLIAKLVLLKPVERGSVAFAAADLTKTVTLATPLLDVSKSIILFSSKTSSNAPLSFTMRGRIISTTQIQFDRSATPTTAQDVEWQVIEFKQGIFVQHIAGVSMATTTVNTTITAVDLAKSFVILSHNNTGNTYGGDDLAYGDLTTTTNLALVVNTAAAALTIAAQVVEIYEATVQKISDTFGTAATKDITVTTITENKTFWFFGLTTSATMNNDQMPYLSYVNSTTLRFTRTNAAGTSHGIRLYVVSLSSSVTVQNIATTIASGGTTVSPTITSVVVISTALNICGLYQRFASASEADDNAGTTSFALTGLTATAFTATRSGSPAIAATTNIQVLQFFGLSSWFLLQWKNEVYNTMQNINGMR